MSAARTARRQAGMGLVELLVAIAIALILSSALVASLSATRGTQLAQTQMANVLDDQRLALAMLTTVAQEAGYFPDPLSDTAASPVNREAGGVFATAGQSLFGTTGTVNGSDTLVVRYVAGSSDGTLDCNGASNTNVPPAAPAPDTGVQVVNTFSVDAGNNLVCQVGTGTAQTLAGNVQSFTVLYGVDLNGDGSVDQYLNATAVNAANSWNNVLSIQVQLTFVNPLPGSTPPPAVTQTIALLSKT
jgi:type IV pilus assembly protein PilW